MAATERTAKRILVDIHPRSIYRRFGFDEPGVLIGIALEALKMQKLIPPGTRNDDSDVRLIIKRISRYDTKIVFDIFHDTYDAAQAHLYGQDPPVLIVSMRKRESMRAFKANSFQELKVNYEIRYLHNRNGVGSQPPFSEDSRQGSAWSFPLADYRDHRMQSAQRQHMIEAERKSKAWLGRQPFGEMPT